MYATLDSVGQRRRCWAVCRPARLHRRDEKRRFSSTQLSLWPPAEGGVDSSRQLLHNHDRNPPSPTAHSPPNFRHGPRRRISDTRIIHASISNLQPILIPRNQSQSLRQSPRPCQRSCSLPPRMSRRLAKLYADVQGNGVIRGSIA